MLIEVGKVEKYFLPFRMKLRLNFSFEVAMIKRIGKEGTNQVFSGGELRKSRELPLLS